MKKIFYLSTCNTCKRIMSELGIDSSWLQRDIKTTAISENELDEMFQLAGSYQALFNKRSRKYKSLETSVENMNETELREHILNEYTFLKRPVIIVNGQIFIGNSPKTVSMIKSLLQS